MAIEIQKIKILNNPAPFNIYFKFQITFNCLDPGIDAALEWKMLYFDGGNHNQILLKEISVGPVRIGKNMFNFEAPAPDPNIILMEDLLDVNVILLTCSYKDMEFIRIGYHVKNEDENTGKKKKNSKKKIKRTIAATPIVTKFKIQWYEQNTNNSNNKAQDDEVLF
eukprot:327287_1